VGTSATHYAVTLFRIIWQYHLSPPFSCFVIAKNETRVSGYNFSFFNITFPSETPYTCKQKQLSLFYTSNVQEMAIFHIHTTEAYAIQYIFLNEY
jgi:hypothetical protein